MPAGERWAGWAYALRRALLPSWYHGVLTVVLLWLLVRAGTAVVDWALTRAHWEVVRRNLLLLLLGTYPRDQLWRVGVAVAVVALLAVWGAALAAGRLRGGRVGAVWLVATLLAGPGLLWLLHGPAGTQVWGGLLLTLILAVAGIAFSFPLGVLLALGRASTLPAVRALSIAYIELVRGTPLMVVLFFALTALPLFLPPGVRPDSVLRAAAGLVLFTAAYLAEAVRGGLQAIPRGQVEAAQALGLTGAQTVLLIILPQALRAVIPAIVGQFISLFKDTSLVAVWGLYDLTGIAHSVLANPEFLGRHVEVYAFVGAVYWCCCYAIAQAGRRLERRLGVGER